MPETTYDYNKSPVNVSLLHDEILNAGLSTINYCTFNEDETPNNLHIVFTDALSTADKTTLDGIVSSHEYESLQDHKDSKNEAIDLKTNELIQSGFTFDGEIFDTSPIAQFNWKNMYDLTNAGIMTFPVTTCTLDNKPYEFANQTEVNNFFLGGVSFIQTHLNAGRALKYQVNACTTKAEVDAIIDTR